MPPLGDRVGGKGKVPLNVAAHASSAGIVRRLKASTKEALRYAATRLFELRFAMLRPPTSKPRVSSSSWRGARAWRAGASLGVLRYARTG